MSSGGQFLAILIVVYACDYQVLSNRNSESGFDCDPGLFYNLGSNLIGPFFFQTRNIPLPKNWRLIMCMLIFCRLSCYILEFFAVYSLHCSCFLSLRQARALQLGTCLFLVNNFVKIKW